MSMLKKIKYTVYSLIVMLILSSCATTQKFNADTILNNGNYPLAIEEFDKDININTNGYFKTLSENGRSEAYYLLALKAIEKDNFSLAIRLLYLANSDKADDKMISCYNMLAMKALTNNQKERVLGIYDYIINNLYMSPRVPEFMYKRIKFNYDWYQNKDLVWNYYTILFEKYPESKYIDSTRVVVDNFLRERIDTIILKKYSEPDPQTIIDSLVYISRYPTCFKLFIYQEIAKIYIQKAELNIQKTEYIDADANFRKALIYDQNQIDYVNKRLSDVCDLFIKHGNKLLDNRQIDEAISFYNRAFTIIPDYIVANEAISKAEKKRSDIKKAIELKEEAILLDRKKKYKEALETFKRAYQYDNTEELANLIFETNNIIEIEKDPKTFAMNVLNNFQKGLIPERINSLKKQLVTKWGKEVKESGWKTIGSATRFKMEIRYDFITPDDNYFLAWQINMKEKTVIPLNKLTEKIVGK